MEQKMAIHRLPCWGKYNTLEQWWTINDFKILCTSYWHEVEGFVKTVLPYFHKGPKSDDNFPEPRTPSCVTRQNTLVSELPVPQCSKVQRFGDEQNDVPPISTITSQGRLTTLLEDDTLNTPPNEANLEMQTHHENSFSDDRISKEPKEFIQVTS